MCNASPRMNKKDDSWTSLHAITSCMLIAIAAVCFGAIEGLRRENESLKERLSKIQDSLSELRRENEEKLNKIQDILSGRQQKHDAHFLSASTIDFDDASTTTGWDRISNGYRDLDWDKFYVIHRSYRPGTGLEFGIVSGDYVAESFGAPSTISSSTPFSVSGFQATAVWNKDLDVLIEGFGRFGYLIGSFRTTLGDPRDGPTFIDLREGNFKGLLKLEITSSGGTDAGLGLSNAQLVIDNLKVY